MIRIFDPNVVSKIINDWATQFAWWSLYFGTLNTNRFIMVVMIEVFKNKNCHYPQNQSSVLTSRRIWLIGISTYGILYFMGTIFSWQLLMLDDVLKHEDSRFSSINLLMPTFVGLCSTRCWSLAYVFVNKFLQIKDFRYIFRNIKLYRTFNMFWLIGK